MRVGIISDTHDHLTNFARALEILIAEERVDVLLHAGDFIAPFAAALIAPGKLAVPVHYVLGNNDGERAGLKKMLPELGDGPLHLELDGRAVLLHHFIDWIPKPDFDRAEIIITGHTHQADIRQEGGRLLINPGECCGWVTGRATVAILNLASMDARVVEICA